MKKLVAITALAILGICFAVEGDCDYAATGVSDPCAEVKAHLEEPQFQTCPEGESCVTLQPTLERIAENDTGCKLSGTINLWPVINYNEKFFGVTSEGTEIPIITEINKNYLSSPPFHMQSLIENVSDFTAYDHYEISYKNGWGPFSSSTSEKKIIFSTVNYTPPPTSDAASCVTAGCASDQTCDATTGECVNNPPSDTCDTNSDCSGAQECSTETSICVDVPPPLDPCESMICETGKVCVSGVCTVQTPLDREGDDEDLNRSRLEAEFDTSEGGCQLSPHAASSASGAPYLWLALTGIALAIARKRLKK